MDTPTLVTLLGILASVLVGIVAFFVVRRLLFFAFFSPEIPNENRKFYPTLEQEPTIKGSRKLSASDELIIVDLNASCRLHGVPLRSCGCIE